MEKRCPAEKFQCREDGTCIPHNWRCDGHTDCDDKSDEEDCGSRKLSRIISYFSFLVLTCLPAEFRCKDRRECVQIRFVGLKRTSFLLYLTIRWVCDGNADCLDGSDELFCEESPTLEEECNVTEEIKCQSDGKCISRFVIIE